MLRVCCALTMIGLLGLSGLAWAAATPTPKQEAPAKGVKLRGLNKVTARSSTIEGSLLSPLEFGKLTIVVKACWIAPTDSRPENAALLEVMETKSDGTQDEIFSGWMFASSPALSSLEHPVYDISVVACVR